MKKTLYILFTFTLFIYIGCDKYSDAEHEHEEYENENVLSANFFLNIESEYVDSWMLLDDMNQSPIPIPEDEEIPAYLAAIYWEEITQEVLDSAAVLVYVETVPNAWELLPISSPVGDSPYGVTFEAVHTIDDELGGAIQFLWIGNDVTQNLTPPIYHHVRVIIVK
jgi:hypothetical protein